MKRKVIVLNNDCINKYGYRFEVSDLEKALAQQWRAGSPSFISHDYHRPIAWTAPFGLWVTPVETVLMGVVHYIETDVDSELIEILTKNFLCDKVLNNSGEALKMFPEDLRKHASEKGYIVNRECVSIVDPGIAKRVLPNLFETSDLDKRSLVDLKKLKPIAPGVFEVDGYAVFAHRFFRRSLSSINNLNQKFLASLQDLTRREKLKVKISLDPDSIGLVDTYVNPIELDFWWGPKFSESLNDIPAGVTQYKSNERQRLFSGIEITEFWWHPQNGIQSLECEEIRDFPSYGVSDKKYGLRYVHSMIDKDGAPDHLDGAIRLYDEEAYIERLGVSIAKAGKNTEYFKLWRIDGALGISEWKSLISDFYKDNYLIGEYFGEKHEEHSAEVDLDEDATLKYVHPVLTQQQGVQICISYHNCIEENNSSKIHICPSDRLRDAEHSIRFIELLATNYLKLVRQSSDTPVSISEDIKIFAFEDHNVNLPLVIFRGNDSHIQATNMMACLLDACKELNGWGVKIVSASFGVEYDDMMFKFSIIGHPQSIVDYLEQSLFSFPDSSFQFGEWAKFQRDLLGKGFKVGDGSSHSLGFMSHIGELKVARKYLSNDAYDLEVGQLTLKLKDPSPKLLELLESAELTGAPVFQIGAVECETCRKNYFRCGCIQKSQIGVHRKIFSVFWARSSTAS
ncbi:hypothetical protein [Pseudomonas syringae]|uniref:hypothetical protein n=1 Tax=Pseudomonas syringae TaxID=317 RepID=UPI00073EDD56|nr:hypothetical protein [Pseudomonas syringae]